MTDKEAIDRWAGYIIPAVFKAETKLQKEHPEWVERLRGVNEGNWAEVGEEYCRAIATEIVTHAVDADWKGESEN